jgi:hypothetical protein
VKTGTQYDWDEDFVSKFREVVHPLVEAAKAEGILTYGVAGGADAQTIEGFREAVNAGYPIYEADDIMLKTIMRSNPGLLLFKNGTILGKWHYRHLPDVATLKSLAEGK